MIQHVRVKPEFQFSSANYFSWIEHLLSFTLIRLSRLAVDLDAWQAYLEYIIWFVNFKRLRFEVFVKHFFLTLAMFWLTRSTMCPHPSPLLVVKEPVYRAVQITKLLWVDGFKICVQGATVIINGGWCCVRQLNK